MLNKLFKLLIITLFLSIQIGFLIALAVPAQAALNDSLPNLKMPKLQISIPGLTFTKGEEIKCTEEGGKKICNIPWIGEYIAGIYKYAIGIVGILAAVVLMIGGVMWIIAGGSATQIGNAKAWIGASLTGLVIALTSYLILYQINPALTVFKPLQIVQVQKAPEKIAQVNCQWVTYLTSEDMATGSLCNNLGPGWSQSDGSCNNATKPPYGQSVCCCPILGGIAMCKPAAPAPTYCDSCLNCDTTSIPCKETPCLINKDLNEKLKALYVLNNGWQITEPWPPTVHHASSCHTNGTCVDISVTNGATSANIINLYNNLSKSNAGFSSYQIEADSCSDYAGLTCVSLSQTGGTGVHIHVNN